MTEHEEEQVDRANASKSTLENPGVTELVEAKGHGHALTIDSRWQEVAKTALDFIRKHT